MLRLSSPRRQTLKHFTTNLILFIGYHAQVSLEGDSLRSSDARTTTVPSTCSKGFSVPSAADSGVPTLNFNESSVIFLQFNFSEELAFGPEVMTLKHPDVVILHSRLNVQCAGGTSGALELSNFIVDHEQDCDLHFGDLVAIQRHWMRHRLVSNSRELNCENNSTTLDISDEVRFWKSSRTSGSQLSVFFLPYLSQSLHIDPELTIRYRIDGKLSILWFRISRSDAFAIT